MVIANEIVRQLGGLGRLKAMIGAKQFIVLPHGVQFGFARGRDGINKVRIVLNGNDLYDVEFFAQRGLDAKPKAEHAGAFADDLIDIFWNKAGLALRLNERKRA